MVDLIHVDDVNPLREAILKKIVANILLFQRAFWQHRIDMKDFLRAKMSQIEGKIV